MKRAIQVEITLTIKDPDISTEEFLRQSRPSLIKAFEDGKQALRNTKVRDSLSVDVSSRVVPECEEEAVSEADLLAAMKYSPEVAA